MEGDRCDRCKHYAKLENPFQYDKEGYPDGIVVHGFCAKDVKRIFSFYPVYLPNGGVCKSFQRRNRIGNETTSKLENQLVLEGVK